MLEYSSNAFGHGGAASAVSPLPSAAELLMGASQARGKHGKRKRVAKEEKNENHGTNRSEKLGEQARITHVICQHDDYTTGCATKELEKIFLRYPPPRDGPPVKVVSSTWLSECLRLESLLPIEARQLLETVTHGSTKRHKTVSVGSSYGQMSNCQESKSKQADDVSSGGSTWGCLAQPPRQESLQGSSKSSFSCGGAGAAAKKSPWSLSTPSLFMSQSNEGGSSSSNRKPKGGVGTGPGGGRGPGNITTEPVYRDGSVSDEKRGRWEEVEGGSVLRWVPRSGSRVSTHIAAFDMDGTLIKSKSGNKFTDKEGDWQLWHQNVAPSMRAWHERGYKIVIISNQLGISKGNVDKGQLLAKVELVLKALCVPVEVFLACEDDYYRKPRPGCWDLTAKTFNGGLGVVSAECLYVGDAAGRPKQGTYKKDFSAGDLKLAINLGIPFQTPEQFFMRSQQSLHRDRSLANLGFNPSVLLDSSSAPIENISAPNGDTREGVLEVVVLVGPPASGKSTLCKTRLSGHVRINQDELSTLNKCKRAAKAVLKEGKSVVIDATNPGKVTRAAWISLADEIGARARCICLTTSKEACFHLNVFRGSNPWSPPKERRIVPNVVIHTWFKNMEPVNAKEVRFLVRELGIRPAAIAQRA